MGLDMYLTANKYISSWNHSSDEIKKTQYRKILEILELEDFCCEDTPSLTVELNVVYWRKANAIHKWFVDNCQDGNDDCRRAYVSREQLEELVNTCKKTLDSIEIVEGKVSTGTTYKPDGTIEHHTKSGEVVAQEAIAASLLPTQAGFFFGSTAYDEWYIKDIRQTVEKIEKILNDKKFNDFEFYYHSSW